MKSKEISSLNFRDQRQLQLPAGLEINCAPKQERVATAAAGRRVTLPDHSRNEKVVAAFAAANPNQIEQAFDKSSFTTTAASCAVAISSLATFLFVPPHFD